MLFWLRLYCNTHDMMSLRGFLWQIPPSLLYNNNDNYSETSKNLSGKWTYIQNFHFSTLTQQPLWTRSDFFFNPCLFYLHAKNNPHLCQLSFSFTMRKGRILCTDPKETWVNELMKKIDERPWKLSDMVIPKTILRPEDLLAHLKNWCSHCCLCS